MTNESYQDKLKRQIRFKITNVQHKRPRGLAQWSSILVPLCDFEPQAIRTGTAGAIKTAIDDLVCQRRSVVGRLWHDELLTKSSYISTVRCPPTACRAQPHNPRCTRQYLCPFCWQRMITTPCIELFTDLLCPDTFTARLGGTPIAHVGVQLIHEERRYPTNTREGVMEVLRQQGPEHSLRKAQYMRGAQSLITVIPRENDTLVRRTLIAIVDKRLVPNKLRVNAFRVSSRFILDPVTQLEEVALAVGEACAYPPEYYSRDFDDALTWFIEARLYLKQQIRLRAFSGILHQGYKPDLLPELLQYMSEASAIKLMERLNVSTDPRAVAPARRTYPCTRARRADD